MYRRPAGAMLSRCMSGGARYAMHCDAWDWFKLMPRLQAIGEAWAKLGETLTAVHVLHGAVAYYWLMSLSHAASTAS